MAGTITIGGFAGGLLSGQKVIGPATVTGSATVGQVSDVTLASGDNTVTVPAGATAVVVFISSANTATIKVGYSASPTNQVGKTGVVYYNAFDSAARPATLYINASGTGGTAEVSFI